LKFPEQYQQRTARCQHDIYGYIPDIVLFCCAAILRILGPVCQPPILKKERYKRKIKASLVQYLSYSEDVRKKKAEAKEEP